METELQVRVLLMGHGANDDDDAYEISFEIGWRI